MSKMKNFGLMLKQGIKGVFQFKAQFIIIIILAFVATFILSISVSTQRRVQASFDKIVKPVDKFKYSGNIQMYSSADSNDDPFLIATEVDNSAPTNLEITQKGLSSIENSDFNFLLNNKDGKYKDSDGNVFKSYLTEGTRAFIEEVKATPNAKFSDNAVKLNDIYLSELFYELNDISKLAKDNKPLDSYDSQTKYSPIALYTYAHPDWLKPFINKINGPTDVTLNFAPTGDATPDRDIFNNVVTGASDITAFLNQSWTDMENSSMSVDDNMTNAIAFLFGKNIGGSVANTNWLGDNYSMNFSIAQDGSNFDTVKPTLATYKAGTTPNSSTDAIYYSGLRGITNPFINGNTKPGQESKPFKATLILNWDSFKRLTINPYIDPASSHHRISSLYREIENDDYWYHTGMSKDGGQNNGVSIDDIVKLTPYYVTTFTDPATNFRVHEKLMAEAAGFKYGIRRETTYFDANNQLKYRGIALTPEEDYNFTILRGRKPSGGNEVAISEQFAKKKNLKVGSTFKSGDAVVTISAIATDAFSYLPQQDLSDPVPNPSVSTFMYGTQGVLDQLSAGSRTSSSSADAVTENYSYFLWDSNEGYAKGSAENKEKAFFALHSNDQSATVANLNAVKQLVKTGTISTAVGSHIKLDDFNKSSYRYSWTLQPLVFKTYDAITYIAAAIIALISLISIGVCVKKTIDLNSKQIGILKALGEKPLAISTNYLSYSIIIGLIVVPIAWIIGNVLQIPFGNMFFTYFSIQPDVILWDWISFVIAFGVLGLFSTVLAFSTAYLLTGKPVLSILVSSVKWGRLRFIDFLKHHVFKKAPFSTRFSLTLTSSGSKQIILMTVVMFVASLLMSAALAIPAVVSRVSSTYYKSVKYANQYNESPMTGNAPLSKGSISDWNGQDWLDKNYVNAGLPLDNSDAKYGYYKDPEAYTASISNSNTLSEYVYDLTDGDKATIEDTYSYILHHQQELLAIVGTMFGNDYFNHIGVSFSVGMVDKFYGLILHSLDNITGLDHSSANYSDDDKINDSQFLSGWLTSSVPQIIKAIVNSNAGTGDASATDSGVKIQTWKQKVMDVIYKVVPSYVKGYIQKSDSRLDQYAIAYNNEFLIPGQETLTTNVDSMGNNIPSMTLTGLDKNQNSIIIDKDAISKAYLSNDIKQQLYNRLNVPVNQPDLINKSVIDPTTGFELYDGSTHTMTLPVIANKQAASAYKLSTGKTVTGWNNSMQEMQFKGKDNIFHDLPSSAWVYEDTDYANYMKNNPDNYFNENGYPQNDIPYSTDPQYDGENPGSNWVYEKSGDNYFINPARVNNNKISFTKEFDNSNNLVDRAQLFKDFRYDKDGNPIGTYVRPYFQYKNMKLMIPKGWVDENKMLWNDGKGHTENGDSKTWYNDAVDAKDIPQSVKDGYTKLAATSDNKLPESAIDGQWLVINPYDLNYYADGFQDSQKMALTNLVDGPGYWYRWSLAGDNQIQAGTTDALKAFHENGAASDLKINLKSVGEIDSYNDKLVVTDSDLANQLLQYPTYRDYEYNYQTFDKSTLVPANTKDSSGYTSEFDRYKTTPTNTPNFVWSDWTKDPSAKMRDIWTLSDDNYAKAIGGNKNIFNYAPHAFFNGKLSNIDEPLEYSSQISFTKTTRIGQQAIALGDATTGGTVSIVTGSTLLSTTKNLIKQVAVLAIAIGAMLVVAIIITAALVTMLTGDIYIAQYKRFMVLLRALGYSKTQVFTYTFGTVTILSLVAWIGGTILAWGLIYVGVHALWASGFAIPMGITWWPIVVSFAVMFISYFGSLWVSSAKARKANPSEVLTATAE